MIGPGFRRHTPATRGNEFLARGFFPPLPEMGFHFVDVRDLAALQRMLFESDEAEGRYIAAGPYFTSRDFLRALKRFNPGMRVLPVTPPRWVFQAAAVIDSINAGAAGRGRHLTLPMVRAFAGSDQRLSSAKAMALGWQPRDFNETLRDTIAWTRLFIGIDRDRDGYVIARGLWPASAFAR